MFGHWLTAHVLDGFDEVEVELSACSAEQTQLAAEPQLNFGLKRELDSVGRCVGKPANRSVAALAYLVDCAVALAPASSRDPHRAVAPRGIEDQSAEIRRSATLPKAPRLRRGRSPRDDVTISVGGKPAPYRVR